MNVTLEPLQILAIAVASMLAGAVNAVAGGGTLLTFPTLIWIGLSPVIANATSNVGLLVGFMGSIGGYRRELAELRPTLPWVLPASIAGGITGALLLLWTPPATFEKLAPFLVLGATLLFMANDRLRQAIAGPDGSRRLVPGPLFAAVQFTISIYGGYFGAGIGILMLAWLGLLGLGSIHRANALKTLVAGCINLVAAALFAAKGVVCWPAVLVMVVGASLGGFLGADAARRVGQENVRRIVTAVGLVSATALAFRALQ